jgi:DNA-directed RNA polymerase II subunit RPB1
MILTFLAVCPPQVRPSVAFDATLRSEDDLTFQYAQILKANNLLKKQEEQGAAGHIINETAALLQFYVATLINNELSSAQSKHKNGRPIKAIASRLKGKEGRLRGNLMGKRVDFSARSVITPDPNLSLDELGVPVSIAMNLTVPEYVTGSNIDYLRQLVEKGPLEWPGAKYIIREDGVKIDLRYIRYVCFTFFFFRIVFIYSLKLFYLEI